MIDIVKTVFFQLQWDTSCTSTVCDTANRTVTVSRPGEKCAPALDGPTVTGSRERKHRLEKEVNKKNWKKPSVLRNLSQPDLEHLVTHTLLRIASVSNEIAQSELNECARSDQNRV